MARLEGNKNKNIEEEKQKVNCIELNWKVVNRPLD